MRNVQYWIIFNHDMIETEQTTNPNTNNTFEKNQTMSQTCLKMSKTCPKHPQQNSKSVQNMYEQFQTMI